MEIFKQIIWFLSYTAVIITTVRMYFTVNKLYKRKHEQPVVESVSIFASFLAVFVHGVLMLNWIVTADIKMAFNDGIQSAAYCIVILVGTGFWVKENRNINFFTLLRKALHLERKESGDLIKALIQPSGAKQILAILTKVAYIDNELDKSELKLIQDFAKQWKIDIPNEDEWEQAKQTNLLDIRNSVSDYLAISPPPEQAGELIDLITYIVQADQKVTPEEEIFLKEVKGMINNYTKGDKKKMFHVLVVPQNAEQFEAIRTLFPSSELEERRGGKVVVCGHYFSKAYSEAICQKYIALGLFSIWEEHK